MKYRILSIVLAVIFFIALFAGSASAYGPYRLVYYDGHIHTQRSDGSGSITDIKAMALRRGLSAVIITDHCKGLTRDEWISMVAECRAVSSHTFLALPGFEVTGSDGIFNRAHMNALGVADPFVGRDSDCLCPEEVWPSPENPAGTGAVNPENLAKWAAYIHAHGGIAVHNHPSGTTKLMYGVDNMEVYNQSHVEDVAGYARQLGYNEIEAWQFGLTLNNFTLYGERDVNMPVPFPHPDLGTIIIPLRQALYYATLGFTGIGQWLGAPEAPLSSWDELLLAYVDGVVGRPIFGLANSDAHNTDDLDCSDGSCSNVGFAKNGAYVRWLTPGELYRAIKAGRTFATTGPSLYLDVNGKIMGETAYMFCNTANIRMKANSENSAYILVKIDIIKNGDVWKTVYPGAQTYNTALRDIIDEDGYYRVEVTSQGSDGSYQFAWSNPVFVRVL